MLFLNLRRSRHTTSRIEKSLLRWVFIYLFIYLFPSSLVFLVQFWWIVFDFLLVGCRYGVCFISFFFFQFSIAMLFILVHVLLFFFFFFFHNCVLPIQIVYVLLSEDLVFFILFMFLVHVPPMCLLKILLIKTITLHWVPVRSKGLSTQRKKWNLWLHQDNHWEEMCDNLQIWKWWALFRQLYHVQSIFSYRLR